MKKIDALDLPTENEYIANVEKITTGKAPVSVAVRDSWKAAEKLTHAAAFEHYYGLGDKRSIPKVAEHMKVAEKTVQTWSTKFHWQERVKDRDLLRIDTTSIHTKLEIDRVKKAVADYIGTELKAVIEYAEDGTIKSVKGPKLHSLKDIEKAVDVYYRITGEAAKEEAAKKVEPTQNMNFQFVIKGR